MKKTVFITGVSTGIGRAFLEKLVMEGYHVIGTVRKEADKLELERQFGEKARILICDITDNAQFDQAVEQMAQYMEGEPLYALINNAGIAVPGPMHLITDAEFEKQMDVNLMATRRVTNLLIPSLRQWGSIKPKIIFISSISGVFAAPFNGAYCVSKHALECLVDIYRRELRYLGIDVISIQPGPLKTEIWRKAKGSFDRFKVGAFASIAEKADKMIQHTEKTALDLKVMTDLIIKILGAPKKKNRYMVHRNALLLKLMVNVLPSSLLDKIIWSNLDKKDAKSYRPV
ncbi:MAG: SDR family NAD(P)-dependent oxidoreductase [Saprospiraceae bacterium]|jgi:NAD(P)-dependent dehydrogenase (short-subunit alcohol dehydrogenase family)|nr:SDR family NAD(P)-dependent oxidoreductase [Chitinophagia bacterium]